MVTRITLCGTMYFPLGGRYGATPAQLTGDPIYGDRLLRRRGRGYGCRPAIV